VSGALERAAEDAVVTFQDINPTFERNTPPEKKTRQKFEPGAPRMQVRPITEKPG